MSERGWFTRRVFPDGKEPDPRFTLANERTFLAWTRTALAFLAGGIALEAFELPGAVELIVLAMAISGGAAVRWVRIERALRHDEPIPAPAIIPVLCVVVFVAAMVVAVSLLA